MDWITNWLNVDALTFLGESSSRAEVLGVITGAWCVYLVAVQHVWNWPIGIVNNVMWIVLFASAGLYADSGLQVVYIVLGLCGWWRWIVGNGANRDLPVSTTSMREVIALAALGIVGTIGMYFFLEHLTDSTVPIADAITTVLSLLATWGQINKRLGSWWLWMAADVIYVPLYLHKGLHLTALLNVGFFLLCVRGYLNWRTDLRRNRATLLDVREVSADA
jgi:nicotinamide mononucleotide transporter